MSLQEVLIAKGLVAVLAERLVLEQRRFNGRLGMLGSQRGRVGKQLVDLLGGRVQEAGVLLIAVVVVVVCVVGKQRWVIAIFKKINY